MPFHWESFPDNVDYHKLCFVFSRGLLGVMNKVNVGALHSKMGHCPWISEYSLLFVI